MSFGAGFSIVEYFLSLTLDDDMSIIVSDYDSYVLEKVSDFFPELNICKFDFFKDDFDEICSDHSIQVDVAVFLGSMYVMDDGQMIKLLRKLKNHGVSRILDFHGGYMSTSQIIRTIIIGYLRQKLYNTVL